MNNIDYMRQGVSDEQLEGIIARFVNLKELQKELGYESITSSFVEFELKEIIYVLNELKAIRKLFEIKEVHNELHNT